MMKLSEVIAALEKHPNKIFKSDCYTAYVNDGLLEIMYNDRTIEIAVFIEREWEEVKEPVDFMTAFKAFREGKSIYSLRGNWGDKTRYVPSFGLYKDFHEADIAEGKWYIED